MTSLWVYLMVGAGVGWLVGLLLRSRGWQEWGLDLAAGMAGASVAAWVAPPLVGAPPLAQGGVSMDALAVAVLGAMAVLALVGSARQRPGNGGQGEQD